MFKTRRRNSCVLDPYANVLNSPQATIIPLHISGCPGTNETMPIELPQMAQQSFALFVDVMGTQQAILSADSEAGLRGCRDRLEDFHRDLREVIEQALATLDGIPEPTFVGEFSDCAYIVGNRFASVAIPGLSLMRRALRHTYPLRGGIGAGNFFHETSGSRAIGQNQIWATSSFVGSAIVTAYQAERTTTPGLRVFVHPLVMQQKAERYLDAYALPLPPEECTDVSTHELRFWHGQEALAATSKIRSFRDSQNLSQKAIKHYDAAIAAYNRFAAVSADLPNTLPALWIFR